MSKTVEKTGIVQVAKLAGVSPMTVTRTLNNSAPVAEGTRVRVLDAAAKLGYRPNPFARAMRNCKTKSIGIMWGLGGPHASTEIVRDMAWTLHQHGYVVYVNNSFSDIDVIRKTLAEYVERRIDGLVFSVGYKYIIDDQEIASLIRQIPAVVTESPDNHNWKCDKLILDYYKPMEEIVDHFAKTGRRRIAAAGEYVSIKTRMDLFERRMASHGLDSKDFFIARDLTPGIGLGQSFVDGLVAKHPDGNYPFDAIWASCDEGAAALMAHFAKTGHKVPEDIAVAGFNNSEMSQYMTPPLASVERMNGQVASSIMKILLNRIDNPSSPLAKETIRMEFVPRMSAGNKGAKPS